MKILPINPYCVTQNIPALQNILLPSYFYARATALPLRVWPVACVMATVQ